jgi:hypothetical protein
VRSFIVSTFAILLGLCMITIVSLISLPGRFSAEYWVRPLIIEKEAIAAAKPAPRVVLLGGSSTLFGYDAGEIQRETGINSINFGLHAGLPLRRLLLEGDRVTARGDLVVMPLESAYYNCGSLGWSAWALRNALSWDRSEFDQLPLSERVRAAALGATPWLLFEQLMGLIVPSHPKAREMSMYRREKVADLWRSGSLTSKVFEYSQFNIDENGDIMHTNDSQGRFPPATGLEDAKVCPDVVSVLREFVARQKARGVTVVFAHHPFLIEGKPDPHWPEVEAQFKTTLEQTGASLVDNRADLFLPPGAFFNMNGHLTAEAREANTARLIRDLRSAGVIPQPALAKSPIVH